MVNKRRHINSKKLPHKYFIDTYVQQARRNGLRSRAWFKLDEIHRKDKLFKPGMTVIDLGASPGGWSQYAITKIGKTGRIIACDLLSMDSIIGVDFIQGDFRDELMFKRLLECVGRNNKVQVIMSDMAPNICGIPEVDMPNTIYLVELALEMCIYILEINGSFIAKIFQGKGFEEYFRKVNSMFRKVNIRKPYSSRVHSREVYIVATGRK